MNRAQINKDFDNLVKYNKSKGIKCEDANYKALLEYAEKNDPAINELNKKIDYLYYIVPFLIICILIIIFLMWYFTEDITLNTLNDLLDENNKSSYIKINQYDAEILED